jgi:hypothetical protein
MIKFWKDNILYYGAEAGKSDELIVFMNGEPKSVSFIKKNSVQTNILSDSDKSFLKLKGFSKQDIKKNRWSPDRMKKYIDILPESMETSYQKYKRKLNKSKNVIGFGYGKRYNEPDNKLAFTTNTNINFYGSGFSNFKIDNYDVIIDLAGNFVFTDNIVIGTNLFDDIHYLIITNRYGQETKKIINKNYIHLPLEDYDMPKIKYKTLLTIYNKIEQHKLKNVGVVCFGGKGRTGTILACFACIPDYVITDNGLHRFRNSSDVIKFIRQNYCYSAIECAAQEQYIKGMFNYMKKSKDGGETI